MTALIGTEIVAETPPKKEPKYFGFSWLVDYHRKFYGWFGENQTKLQTHQLNTCIVFKGQDR